MCISPGMRICLLGICLVGLSQAETAFQNLTPNYDGSAVWFSSRLRMKGADQYAHPKIFRWDETKGIQLYEQKAASITTEIVGGWRSETAYNLFWISASADGATVAVNGLQDCNFGSVCAVRENFKSEIHRSGTGALNLDESASLSPNGRFAYLTSSLNLANPTNRRRLRDLQTGQEILFDGAPTRAFDSAQTPRLYRHQVANNGSVVAGVGSFPPSGAYLQYGVYLRSWPSGELRPIPTRLPVFEAMINDSGTRLVYWHPEGLGMYDIPAARETSLLSITPRFPYPQFDISNDGAVIA